MTGTGSPLSVSAGANEEAAYYQTIEEFFVSRRGDPLFLSNADWLIIRKWRTGGVPLRIVLRGIKDALDGHAHSWSRKRKVGSLSYCAAEVEAARDRWQRALSFEGEAQSAVAAALEGFAEALERATGLGPRASEVAKAVAMGLRALQKEAKVPPEPREDLAPRLLRAERGLLAAIDEETDTAVRAEIDERIDADLAPYRERMPERVLDQIRDEARARALLARHGLPRLSLFHL